MPDPAAPSEATVIGYLNSMSNWGRWGDDDELGALNLLTSEKVASAADLVAEGRTVSLSRIIEFAPRADGAEAPLPPLHFMQASGEGAERDGVGAAHDWVGLPLHGHYLTHVDAPSHFFYERQAYNGIPSEVIRTDHGATRAGVDVARRGIVSRGILLDVPRARGVDWLDGNDTVTAADLVAAERLGAVACEPGDVVLVRTGYGARRRSPKDRSGPGIPGLAANCLPWIRERDLPVIGTDTGTDAYPANSAVLGGAPVHLVCIVTMGMWIIDNMDLEELAVECAVLGRYEFFFTAAPLRLKNSTGSPLNPLAIF